MFWNGRTEALKSSAASLFEPIDDLWRTVRDGETRRDREERRIRFCAGDVRKLERLLTDPRIASLAGDDGTKIRRCPDLGHDVEGAVVADLASRNRAGRANALHDQ